MKMKKMISAVCAAVMAASAVTMIPASADDAATLSFRPGKNVPEGVSASEALTRINLRLARKNGDTKIKVPVDVFYTEPTAGAWFVRANWKCTAPADTVALTDLTDPFSDPVNLVLVQLDDPFAFAVKMSNGGYKFADESGSRTIAVNRAINTELNTMGFTVRSGGSMEGPLVPLGEKTDSYPFASFNLTINTSTAKAGEYDIHFLEKAEDDPDQKFCEVNINHAISVPASKNMKIEVIDYLLGDVNNDGLIDSNDASLILAEYATTSTGGEKSFDDLTFKVADTNFDNLADSNDASNILSYYAYAATASDPKTIEEFLGV